ncbi:MAG: LamG domain-containing protein, partial [Bacteroidaceae bacterium]|nr:LamG domain-containing protein [Bacteroidaceae bacterium]
RRYRITETGTWHHLALTYDSHVEKDNIRFYVDGMLMGTQTERGPIAMGNNPIVIGPSSASDYYVNETYVDNFAVFSRALTEEEIMQHIYSRPDAKDKDCRLLLTFDGSLQDQSQYHNDPAPLLENYLKAHDGIRPPHPEFSLTKDLMGQTIYMTDMTQDGEAYQWIKPDPWNLERFDKYSTSKQRHDKQDVSGHPGLYNYWMIAKGDGKTTNAYVATQQSIVVGGLSRVFPAEAAQEQGVRLRIQGGYNLTYSNQPKVVLKQGTTEVEGKWLIEYGYDMRKAVQSADQLPEAMFDLSAAPVGKYDVIVGSDTLSQAFTLNAAIAEIPDVWMQVNGRGASLWNKWQRYTIDYGNRSGVAAYNTPIFLVIPDRHGTIDVAFEFEFDICDLTVDNYYEMETGKRGDYLMAYDEKTQDSIRVYSFMIPYIAPNSTNQVAFRIKMAPGTNEPSNEITMGYWIEQPWGPYDPEAVQTRAPYTLEQGECFAMKWGQVVFETAIGFVPGASCIYSIAKNGYSTATGAEGKWSTLFTNLLDVGFSCAEEFIPGAHAAQAAWKFASMAWSFYSNYQNMKDMRDCLKGDPNGIKNQGRGSYDPNEMIGPWGPDEERHYIQPVHDMAYTITFENKASATAPAHEVFVTDTLDLTKLDAATFSFTSYGWADTTFQVGGSKTQEFTRDVQYKVNGQDIIVRVSGQFSPATGVARWAFLSLSKDGGEIDDPDLGFLLPNNDNHDGEGFVGFTIEHKKNPANGSTVSNKATIVFDANEPIVTNTYVNTFDTDYPTSKVTGVKESDGNLVITLQGSDATSGISHYNIYAFKNGGEEAELLASNVTTTQVIVPCEPGTHYALCAIATDNVGWNEPKDLKTEMEITTSGEAPGPNEKTTDVNVSAEGYATFYDSQDNYKLPSELSAYVVTEAGSTLRSHAINGSIIPKGVPVYLSAREKKATTYTLTATKEDASYNGSNLLHGSDAATMTTAQEDCLFYKLAYGPSDTPLQNLFGWFWGAPYGAAFHIDAHRAWLAVPKTRATRGYLIGGDGTGIDIPVEDGEDMEVQLYDMQGRPVSNTPKKGLYIRNNKKIFIK